MMKATQAYLRLVVNNKTAQTKPRVETAAGEATVYLYDVIDPYWGVSAANFVKALNDIDAGVVHLRINSPGGDVFDATAMRTALAQHKARVIAHIDGLAASAASIVMLGADEIEIVEGGFVMIHNAWALAMGNADAMRTMGDLLDKIDDSIAGGYARRTGQSKDTIVDWMEAETWFSAEEAVGHKFADRVVESIPAEARTFLKPFDLSAFTNAPAAQTDDRATALRLRAQRRLALYDAFGRSR